MTEDTATGAEASRGMRRSTRVTKQLEQLRERETAQRAEEEDRRRRLDQGMRDYAAAAAVIADKEESAQRKIDGLRARIVRLEEEMGAALSESRDRQARAVLEIHQAGKTVQQVAELLNLSAKRTRQLIKDGRRVVAAAAEHRDDPGEGAGGVSDHSAAAGEASGMQDAEGSSGEPGELGWVEGEQDRPDAGFVPAAVADGGAQRA